MQLFWVSVSLRKEGKEKRKKQNTRLGYLFQA